jgi:hypothetical protein
MNWLLIAVMAVGLVLAIGLAWTALRTALWAKEATEEKTGQILTSGTQQAKETTEEKKVPESFKSYEDGKHRRYQLLFAVNGGAFAVAKLFADKDAKDVLGSLYLPHLSLGMIVFTIVMVADIFLFGKKMRENYLPGAFDWQGRLVLALIGVLICLGWCLVGWNQKEPPFLKLFATS